MLQTLHLVQKFSTQIEPTTEVSPSIGNGHANAGRGARAARKR
jgi:hypothetical protein